MGTIGDEIDKIAAILDELDEVYPLPRPELRLLPPLEDEPGDTSTVSGLLDACLELRDRVCGTPAAPRLHLVESWEDE